VENTARDHRLRLLFPLPFRTDAAMTEGHFHVESRGLHATRWNGRSDELPPATFPHKSFVAFERDGTGIAVFNRGLPDGEVEELSDGRQAYALTLLRSVGWLSRDDLVSRRGHAGPQIATHDSQMIGRHRFAFAITTYGGDWRSAGILPMAHSFAHQPFAVTTNSHDGYPTRSYPLATFDSADVVPSALHRSHESGAPVLRAFSVADVPQAFGVSVPNVAGHRRVDLLERDTAEWSGGGEVALHLRPWEIASVRFDRHGG
jgi:mannosylglycerate hydrolase